MSNRELLERIAYIGGILIFVYLIFRFLLPLVLPFLLAYIVSGLLVPIVRKLNNRFRVPNKIGTLIILILVIGILTALIIWLAVSLSEQIRSLVSNMPIIRNEFDRGVKNMCCHCEGWLGMKSGSMYEMIELGVDYLGDNYLNRIMPFVTEKAWGVCVKVVSGMFVFMFFILGTWMIMGEYDSITDKWKSRPVIIRLLPVITEVRHTVSAYLRTQGIIISVIAIICSGALFLIGNPYALLIGIIIAVFDAFPLVGSGSILIPWGIICTFQGRLCDAGILAAAYLLSLITREILEAKIMGHSTGLSPIYMLASFYIGIQLYGVAGVILGPIGTVLAMSLYRQLL